MPIHNVVLIGMPASGKSTLGVMLAKALGWDYLDTDVFIQAHEGYTLREIIRTRGTKAFRALETRTVCKLDLSHFVIATGGSVVFGPLAMEHLQQQGLVVWLRVGLDALARRIGDLERRGVLHRPGQTLGDILAEREALYEKYAQVQVRCDGKSPERIVTELVACVKATPTAGGQQATRGL